ncbi:S-layer homology domain-containing protein [Oscillatoria sp. FACHB-1406]|uniref:S-layer homology domain-containing protein n=1 Tax=Oscillatoria sp. FACHB-1406 TaxID=2692846 RepID=UPI0016884CD4|nr:S-layer homology domain-containing protein [Oscillatoria sp. FACHB-1406]MBD2580628.1 S-layer homology domain-containing protein [Oscillatoria sp. FACHB-1406]
MASGRPICLYFLISCLGFSVAACANNPNFGRWFAPDPKLQPSPTPTVTNSPQPTPTESVARVPANFPTEIPRYPNAELIESELTSPEVGTVTRWTTPDSGEAIAAFYERELKDKNWEILSAPSPSPALPNAPKTIAARQKDLKIVLSIPNKLPTDSTPGSSFELSYLWESTATPSPVTSPTPTNVANVALTDISTLPAPTQNTLRDLAALGVIPATGAFEPNKAINRAEFARWLVMANNALYANNPGKQIRLIPNPTQPAFKDVPKSNPNFAYIQGLAEAGLIPSPLSGNTSATLFQPDAPLTRENLVLWKVPLDTRQALPKGTLDNVQKTWGFKDSGQINPIAFGALAADYQNDEQSNIRRAFGFTTLLQPKKPVSRAEAGTAIGFFGYQGEGVTAQDALQLKAAPQSTPADASTQPTPESASPQPAPSTPAQ